MSIPVLKNIREKLKYYLLIIGMILFSSCSTKDESTAAVGQNKSDSEDHQAIAWIENNLTATHSLQGHVHRKTIVEIMADYNIPGVSMAFVDQGKIAWTQTYGYANFAKSEKVTTETVFTGASLSKPLAAIAALHLVEAAKLDLDEDVNNRLKAWQVPENEFTQQEKVTLRHLISHRAGVKNDLWSSYLPEQSVPSLAQMLAGQSPSVDPATSVVSVPGSAEKYSNPGYSIIQQMLEDVTGEAFEDVLDKLVLQPSKMADSSFAQPMPDYLQQRRAVGYDNKLQPYPYKLFPFKAAGGVWTTPSDMARFVLTLFEDHQGQNNILSPAMTTNVFSRDRIRLGFSKIFNGSSNDLVFRHYGSNQGFTCYLIGSLVNRQAIVIMTNSDNGFDFLDYTARAVAEFYKWDYLQPTVHQKHIIDSADLSNYVGQFNHNNDLLGFEVQDNALVLTFNSSAKQQWLIPIGKSEFISTEDSVKYQFLLPRGNSSNAYEWLRITSAAGKDDYAGKVQPQSEVGGR